MAEELEKRRQINIVFNDNEMDRRLWEWISADRAAAGRKFNLNDTFKTLLYDWYVARDKAGSPPPPIWKTNGGGPPIPAGAGGSVPDEDLINPDDDLVQDLINSQFEF